MYFIQQILTNPALTVTTLLTLGVIFVNGWTDAPNAIATCVTTRCMRVRSAVIMAAVFNFRLGGLHHQQHGGFRWQYA